MASPARALPGTKALLIKPRSHVPAFPERLAYLRVLPVQARLLRGSFPSKATSEASPLVLTRLLGHSDIKTTMRYVHASGFDDLAAALDRMD